MTISALPTPPSPLDTPAEFNTKAFNLLGALPDFVTEANALSTDVNAKSSAATSAASSASSSATSASNSATAAAASATSAAGSATSASGSASSASSSAATALSEANRAAAAAATVDLPAAPGNALKLLRQNAGNTALEYFSIVGPVSQSGGLPAGAIIERGINANGQYVRFADGTQICVNILASSAAGQQSWTYPAAFSANLYNLATVDADGAYYANTTYGSLSNMTFGAYTGASRVSVGVLLLTIGRWY